MARATATGTQPPCMNLTAVAPKKAKSTLRKAKVTRPALTGCHSQTRTATTKANTVVMIMVAVTAMPYAAARRDDEPNDRTSRIVATMSIQLMLGTYT